MGLVVLMLIASNTLSQGATTYSSVLIFGDSLSDSGNVFAATGGSTPPAPYFNGRFSNGPTWVEQLATNHLSLPAPMPSSLGGTNHAWGGATTGVGGLVPSVRDQVNGFITSGGTIMSTDLVIVWAGANDLLAGGTPDTAFSVSNLSDSIELLLDAGAATILVPNLPNLSRTPEATGGDPTVAFGLQLLTIEFNIRLESELDHLRGGTSADLASLNIFALSEQIHADPTAFGLPNGTESALAAGITDSNANGYLYWDQIHPTEAVHGLFAESAAQQLGIIPEPMTTLLILLGLPCLLSRRRQVGA